ncbi:uncharacterized protein LOC128629035 isoform X1 [Ictalurus punctatus]|uniref:Uncharacterized protein LOC128629035 isoform X1 n=1 Tax=Ictalurus punctatus TaxID=7998 RepID=A0A9F7R6P3_ICTPU|nr:uncharacterized protein LOC128629035 isoform X1 [Ictalurus punctatus]
MASGVYRGMENRWRRFCWRWESRDNTDTRARTSSNTDTRARTSSNTDTRARTSSNTDTRARTSSNTDTRARTSGNTDTRARTSSNTDTRARTSSNTDTRARTSRNTDTRARTSRNTDTTDSFHFKPYTAITGGDSDPTQPQQKKLQDKNIEKNKTKPEIIREERDKVGESSEQAQRNVEMLEDLGPECSEGAAGEEPPQTWRRKESPQNNQGLKTGDSPLGFSDREQNSCFP